jgi:hypothetical protein
VSFSTTTRSPGAIVGFIDAEGTKGNTAMKKYINATIAAEYYQFNHKFLHGFHIQEENLLSQLESSLFFSIIP